MELFFFSYDVFRIRPGLKFLSSCIVYISNIVKHCVTYSVVIWFLNHWSLFQSYHTLFDIRRLGTLAFLLWFYSKFQRINERNSFTSNTLSISSVIPQGITVVNILCFIFNIINNFVRIYSILTVGFIIFRHLLRLDFEGVGLRMNKRTKTRMFVINIARRKKITKTCQKRKIDLWRQIIFLA